MVAARGLFAFLAVATVCWAQNPALYGQCGGSGYTGSNICPADSRCLYQNEWFSMCMPNNAASVSVANSSPTPQAGPPPGCPPPPGGPPPGGPPPGKGKGKGKGGRGPPPGCDPGALGGPPGSPTIFTTVAASTRAQPQSTTTITLRPDTPYNGG
ncbi:hypothetical protein GQ53DRAFT_807341 [Thozetella sp. PMI_491]|nr:hypothetical protein GQ53DRAFT_807341 [Thozetella sp. PMI_491]